MSEIIPGNDTRLPMLVKLKYVEGAYNYEEKLDHYEAEAEVACDFNMEAIAFM